MQLETVFGTSAQVRTNHDKGRGAIILAEIQYWKQRTGEPELLEGVCFGAVVSLANVLASFKLGLTAEQHKEEIAQRPEPWKPPFQPNPKEDTT